MKIVIATPLYPPEIGRLAVYTRGLAKYLQKDHEVTVLAYAQQTEDEDGINIVKVNKNQPLFIRLLSYTWSLFKLAKHADIIYVQNAVAAGLPAIIVKYLTKKPVVINFVEDEAWKRAVNLGLSRQSLGEFLNKPKGNGNIRKIINTQSWVLRRASKVIVPSASLMDLISKKYKVSEDKIVFNYLPEDREEKLPFETKKISQQIFVSGPLLEWTGIEEIIKAVAGLKDEFKEIKLIISGDGPNKTKLIKLAKDLGILSNVQFLGKISKAENGHILKISEVYIHNFLDFDSEYQITKSFLAATLVIVKDTKFNRDILGESQSGLILKEGEDLSYKIKQIFENNNLVQELISKAKLNLENNFSWTAHIDKINSILLKLLKK